MNMPLVLLNRRRRGGAAAAPAFSPSGLFALAEPGVWYDPSDLTTLFQDPAGTLPVTTPGQTMALALDKSKGLVLGSEAASNSWGGFQCNVTSSGGNFTATATANNDSRVVMQIPTVVGRTYRISVGLVSTTSGTVSVGYNETASSVAFTLATGIATISVGQTSTFFVTATNTNINLVMRSVALAIGQTFVFAPASVKELPGFHATQATLASRPTYGIVPLGGRRNLLLNTDTLATQSRTVTAAAHTLSFTGTGTITLTGASTAGPLIGTGAGNRVSLTFTPTAGSLTMTVLGSVTLAQLELGSTVTNYQRVGTSAFDVTEAGVASLSYLSFDGVDDFMVTPTITPGIDKVQVFAGVRKLSDAAAGVLAEFSITVSGSNGAFLALAPDSARPSYALASRGTTVRYAEVITGYSAPDTRVFTGLADISGDLSTLRLNGTQVAQNTADQGTGNFLAYPLYIGRRAGASLPFNGQIYSLLVRFGTNLDAGTITSTETWVNGKTGAYA